MKTIKEWVKTVHANAKEHGWWEDFEPVGYQAAIEAGAAAANLHATRLVAAASPKLLMIHSEISEATEEMRALRFNTWYGEDGKPEGLVVELADAVIRIFDLCGALGLDIERAIAEKHEYNKGRPYKHGGKAL